MIQDGKKPDVVSIPELKVYSCDYYQMIVRLLDIRHKHFLAYIDPLKQAQKFLTDGIEIDKP